MEKPNIEGVSTFLARLLATENLKVVFSPMHTAAFDMNSRTMYLPIFKEENGESVNDLFISHEVGHALWTPAEGWHDAVSNTNIPKDILNILEDIRIESLIKNKYPGLHGVFQSGYSRLLKNNFFGVIEDVNSMDFLNRLNVKSKTGDLVKVTFEGEEKILFEDAQRVKTWEDVLEVAKRIVEYLKKDLQKKSKENPQNPQNQEKKSGKNQQKSSEQNSGENSGENFGENSEQNSGKNSEKSSKQSSEENFGENSEENSEENSGKNSRSSNSKSASINEKGELEVKVETDRNARNNERNLVENSSETFFVEISENMSNDLFRKVYSPHFFDAKKSYADFLNQNRNFGQNILTQFNLYKAAFQQKMQSENKFGQIDPLKLINYKFNDNIFKRTTTSPRSQNHGIIIVLDASGSMSGSCFNNSLKYLCILAEFCYKAKIPVKAIAFSSNNDFHTKKCNKHEIIPRCKLVSLIDSSSKESITLQIGNLWKFSKYKDSIIKMGLGGGTPLEETMLFTSQIIKNFQEKNNLEQIHTILLSDGNGDNIIDTQSGSSANKKVLIVDMDGKRHKYEIDKGLDLACFEIVRKMSSSFTTFFFTPEYQDKQNYLKRYIFSKHKTDKTKIFEKNYGFEITNYFGRDSFFLIPNQQFNSLATKELCIRTGRIIAQYRTSKI